MKALKAKALLDGTGAAPIENPVVLIDGKDVVDVLSLEEFTEHGSGAEVIDCRDRWVLPGFIDLHVHLRNPHDDDVPKDEQFRHRITAEPPLAVLYGARAAQRCLAAGFTTLRNMGGVEYTALDCAFEVGILPGPRVFTSGMVLKSGGHTDRALPDTLPREGAWAAWKTADGPDEVRRRVRELRRAGAAFIKLEASGGLYQSDVQGYTPEELQCGIEEAHSLGLRVAVHAHSRDGILAAVRAGANTIEHGTFMDDECIEAMVRQGTTFVPTMAILRDSITRGPSWGYTEEFLEKEKRLLKIRMEATRRAFEAGVPIGLGTDSAGWIGRHGENAHEFALLVEAGLSPTASVAAGTGNAAAALGKADSIGTLGGGKRADLVVVRTDPMADISSLTDKANIEMVWKDGEILVDRRTGSRRSELIWSLGD